jgi:hypothetical protein
MLLAIFSISNSKYVGIRGGGKNGNVPKTDEIAVPLYLLVSWDYLSVSDNG